MQCIICREEKEKADFNDEHIIPDSLGGYSHINTVCTTCNSNLGTNVDGPLVNHFIAKYLRYRYQLKGKEGKVPNPFDSTYMVNDNADRKAKILINENGVIEPYFLPKIEVEDISAKTVSIMISVDNKDKNQFKTIINKIVQRNNLEKIDFSKLNPSPAGIVAPKLSTEIKIDLLKFKIGLLKIAYEFAITNIMDYVNDPMALEIANVLKNNDYGTVLKYANIGDGFQKEILAPFTDYLDFDSAKHYLILWCIDGCLYCYISLLHTFVIGIKLSDKNYLDGKILVGINCLSKSNFVLYNYKDIIDMVDEVSYIPLLQFETHENFVKYKIEESHHEFGYIMNDYGFELFDRDGSSSKYNMNQLIDRYIDRINELVDLPNLSDDIIFDAEVYIKTLNGNQLIRLLGLKEIRKHTKKI